MGGDDGIADTPLDHQCWTQNQIAFNSYGQAYTNLNGSQQYFVDNTWSNIMSYHSPGNRFTNDQLDRMTDYSNRERNNVASGYTRFVDRNGNPSFQFGSSTLPYLKVADGINYAAKGDIVLVRAGHYNEQNTFTNSVTLRSSRGMVSIGRP